jgi:hypothetical protein
MVFFRHPSIVLLLSILLSLQVNAETHQQHYSRNFWSPTYQTQRLNYCSLDGKMCGLAVANKYCKMMGYERADEALIDYGVGLTNYLLSQAQCKGWRCNGFMLITCVGNFSHKPEKNYYYRSQRFAYPRFDHYRVAWCYENAKGCGQRAAFSFCRRMGYMNAQYYKKEEDISATKALGNQQLCFGEDCDGFSSITCYR